ncbi:MAG: T9SS type A sorting domain-containing protein [Flavobacteriales bacterium]
MKHTLALLSAVAVLRVQAQQITGYEYWFDRDHDARVWVDATAPATDITLAEAIPAGTLAVGPHTVRYRVKDAAGHWSSVLNKPFRVDVGGPNNIVGGEYWFDQDDDDAERTPFTLGPGQSVEATINALTAGLARGPHWVRYRLTDTRGNWSSVLSKPFRVTNAGPYRLVELRYWSDPAATDPRDMTVVPITTAVQYLDIIDDVLFCNWSTTGQTNVYFQLKDDHAQWSSVLTRNYTVNGSTAPPAQPGVITGNRTPPEGTSVTYSVAPVPGASYYTWTLPNGWSGTSTTNSITATVGHPGPDGIITVAASNGCGTGPRRDLTVTVSGTGVSANIAQQGIALFPNPTTGQFTLVAEALITRVLVHNSTGQLVRELDSTGTDRIALDLAGEAGGLYTVRVFQGDRHSDMRVMVQH